MSSFGYANNYGDVNVEEAQRALLNYQGKQFGGQNSGLNEMLASPWGKLGFGLQSAAGLFNAYNGYKQLGLAEDQFNFQRDYANTNLANQAAVTNADMEHRQRMRMESARITGDEADRRINAYMDKNSVRGTI